MPKRSSPSSTQKANRRPEPSRIRRDRLVRNACIAAGNSGQAGLSEHLIPLVDDHSPLVRGHAAWALGRLGEGSDVLNERLTVEADEDVRRELALALGGE